MGTLQRLSFQIDLREMLQGRIVIRHVEWLKPVVRLESSAKGIPNWLFVVNQGEGKTTDEIALPSIGQIVIQDGRFSYHDYATKFAAYAGPPTETERFVDIAGEGRMQGQPLHLKGRVGSLQALHDAQAPYPVQAALQLGKTQARVLRSTLSVVQSL